MTNDVPTAACFAGTPTQEKSQGGIVDMDCSWVYMYVNLHLQSLGKPAPLEYDRRKWCTAKTLRKCYDLARDTALEHDGLAVRNESFVPGH